MAETLTEEREDLILSPSTQKPCFKIAHFLKPSLPTSNQPQNLQTLISPRKPISPNTKSLTSTVNFHGWRRPLEKWNFWVQKMLPSFESNWQKTSIFDSIMASTHEIPRCLDTMFALAQRWCPETSSFLLPWGEVTITLEDVMVLGGYSVLGDSVSGSGSSQEMLEIEAGLDGVRRELIRSKAKKADQQQWMNVWMEKGSEFEHEAFLSLWLSMCVLPSDSVRTIHKSVFTIAIRLARGTRIALAPAVLARIYRDLRFLKEKIETFGVQDEGNLKKLNLWAPLQLLQMWVWERFPELRPVPNVTYDGQPRSLRWHKVKILRKNAVGLAIDSAQDSFQWRPYSSSLSTSPTLASFYQENARWVSVSTDLDLGLQSYARFIRVSCLVGLDKGCIEQYLPHRVSMQFGFDQDIPGAFVPLSNNSEIAWNNYNRPIKDVRLYVPSRLREPGVTARYLEWWNNSKSAKNDEKNGAVNLSHRNPKMSERMRIKLENNEAEVPPGYEKMSERMRIQLENNEAEVPPGYEPKGKRVRLEGDEGDATRVGSFPIKDGDAEDDSDDDNQTLSQLMLKRMNPANESGAFSVSSETPFSSAGDNVCIRDERNTGLTEPSGTDKHSSPG